MARGVNSGGARCRIRALETPGSGSTLMGYLEASALALAFAAVQSDFDMDTQP
jgi:hypothetical protein